MSEVQTQKPVAPSLHIPLPDSHVRKTFLLKEQLSRLLTEYTDFLSSHHARRIDETLVLETLIAKLSKDRNFRGWKARRET